MVAPSLRDSFCGFASTTLAALAAALARNDLGYDKALTPG